MMEHLRSVVANVTTAGNDVDSGSRQLAASAQGLSQDAAEQAATGENLAAAMERITDGAQEVGNRPNDRNNRLRKSPT